MLNGKTIVVGVTGSIAAYKTANLVSMLVKQRADVHVIMTRNACNFITPTTFETLTRHKCLVDTFDRNFEFQVEHVALAKRADLFIIAPATANVIGKLSAGICDDMLTTTVFATKVPVLLAPAMNTAMWENPVLQDNLQKLRRYGYRIIQPATGRLACGDTGSGKMPSEDILMQHILLNLASNKDMAGRRVLVTAGPTCEDIDPVRYITNHSSGKMGYALAKAARSMGAEVELVSGKTEIMPPYGVSTVFVSSAEEMYNAVLNRAQNADIIVMAAAVADYTPAEKAPQKIKKSEGEATLVLKRTKDILAKIGRDKTGAQVVVGFSMETENLLENSRKKLAEKNADMIVANSIADAGTGFGVDTNAAVLITKDSETESGLVSKDELARMILEKAAELCKK